VPAQLQGPAAQAAAITVTPATTAALNAHFKGSAKRPAKGIATVTPHEALAALAKLLGPAPADLPNAASIANLISQVECVVGDSRSWERLDKASRRMLVEAVAARIRAVQERRHVERKGQSPEKIDRQAARLMQALAAQHGSGKLDRFAYGPAVSHRPRGADWLVDARALDREIAQELGTAAPNSAEVDCPDAAGLPTAQPSVDELFRRLRQDIGELDTRALVARLRALLQLKVAEDDKRFAKLLEPRLGELSGVQGLTRLVRRVLERLAEQDPDDVDAPAAIGPDWPGLAHTRGKRAVIVGGDGRVQRKEVLRSALGLASLEWADLPKKSPGRTSSLVQKVRRGSFDLVICLQKFISHSITDQLFGLAVPGVTTVLARGYGLLQVKLALDRFLPQPAANEC
jgi:hypothetical protein